MSVRILVGDALERMREIPDQSVHCVVTSPPYWAMRTYKGGNGMIGLEPTFADHIDVMLAIFKEIWRVMRDDGVCWMNYGDSYAHTESKEFKRKDLMMMPARVAIALCDSGWYVRSKVIWHKENATPESVYDRPGNCYEEVFLLTKEPKNYYDYVAVRTEITVENPGPVQIQESLLASDVILPLPPEPNKKIPTSWTTRADTPDRPDRSKQEKERVDGFSNRWVKPSPWDIGQYGTNQRNVWVIPTAAYDGDHFATFPPKLVEPCILAGTSTHGCCAMCGTPYTREIVKEFIQTSKKTYNRGRRDSRKDVPYTQWG